VLIRDGANVHIVPLAKIDYAEAQDDYVSIHAERRAYLKEQTMAQLEASLDPAHFLHGHPLGLLRCGRHLRRLEPHARAATQLLRTERGDVNEEKPAVDRRRRFGRDRRFRGLICVVHKPCYQA